jgi:hypothetical protein
LDERPRQCFDHGAAIFRDGSENQATERLPKWNSAGLKCASGFLRSLLKALLFRRRPFRRAHSESNYCQDEPA